MTVGTGSVITAQYPAAYSTIASGSKVILYMGETPEDTMVTLPDLSNMTYIEAQRRLENMGLFITYKSGTPGEGVVVGMQSTPAGEQVPYGSVIEVSLVDKSIGGDGYTSLG